MNNTASAIREFKDDFAFLSNFFPVSVLLRGPGFPDAGIRFPTSEHAFAAAKTTDIAKRVEIAKIATPGQAKRAGRKVALRPDWERIKIDVMRQIVRAKFRQHPRLAEKLLATGDAELVEGNSWGDTFWGVDLASGKGENWLGRILMEIRTSLRTETGEINTVSAAPVAAKTTVVTKKTNIAPNRTCPTHSTPLLLEAGGGGKYSCPRCA